MPSVLSSPRGYGRTEETIMTEPVISVVGGTGAQGGGVVDALLAARKFKVRVASRNPSSDAAKALTARGVEVVKANLLEPSSLKTLYDGARGAFLVTNFGDPAQRGREEEIGAGAVNAARSARVKHLIWSTLPDVEKISGGRLKVEHFTMKAHVDPAARVIHAGDITELGRTVAAAFDAGAKLENGSYLAACGGTYSWNDFVE